MVYALEVAHLHWRLLRCGRLDGRTCHSSQDPPCKYRCSFVRAQILPCSTYPQAGLHLLTFMWLVVSESAAASSIPPSTSMSAATSTSTNTVRIRSFISSVSAVTSPDGWSTLTGDGSCSSTTRWCAFNGTSCWALIDYSSCSFSFVPSEFLSSFPGTRSLPTPGSASSTKLEVRRCPVPPSTTPTHHYHPTHTKAIADLEFSSGRNTDPVHLWRHGDGRWLLWDFRCHRRLDDGIRTHEQRC